jgi:DNA-binding MarR family transcriptional regulator
MSAHARPTAIDRRAGPNVNSCTRNCQSEGDLHARATLHLPSFVPFRLNRLAVAVSNYLSVIYRERFGLDVPEWRVLVTVGPERGCTAQYIAGSTRMHKTRVSRAIAHLEELGLMERTSSTHDRRAMELRLSKAGRRMYQELVPLALERERALLSCLDKDELRGFMVALENLERLLDL